MVRICHRLSSRHHYFGNSLLLGPGAIGEVLLSGHCLCEEGVHGGKIRSYESRDEDGEIPVKPARETCCRKGEAWFRLKRHSPTIKSDAQWSTCPICRFNCPIQGPNSTHPARISFCPACQSHMNLDDLLGRFRNLSFGFDSCTRSF